MKTLTKDEQEQKLLDFYRAYRDGEINSFTPPENERVLVALHKAVCCLDELIVTIKETLHTEIVCRDQFDEMNVEVERNWLEGFLAASKRKMDLLHDQMGQRILGRLLCVKVAKGME